MHWIQATLQRHSHERIDDMENSNGAADSRVIGVPTYGGQYVKYTVAGTDFEVPMRYKPPIRLIGRGAYGVVWLEILPLKLVSFLSSAFILLKTVQNYSYFTRLLLYTPLYDTSLNLYT